jgi:ketosteroid isomerase-like protein
MSQQSFEIVRAAIDAANRRDWDAFVLCLDPEVVWDDTEGFAGLRGVYRGPAEVRDWFEAALEPWDTLEMTVDEIREADGGRRVFVGGAIRGRGKASGAEADVHVWQVLWLRGGKIARRQLYWTRDEAVEAAGLRD